MRLFGKLQSNRKSLYFDKGYICDPALYSFLWSEVDDVKKPRKYFEVGCRSARLARLSSNYHIISLHIHIHLIDVDKHKINNDVLR